MVSLAPVSLASLHADQAAVKSFVGKSSLNATFYPIGTELWADGNARARARRRAWEQRPALGEGMDAIVAAVAAERRQDVPVGLGDLRIDSLGRLDLGPGAEYSLDLSPVAYRQLASEAPAEAFGPNLNSWLRGSDKRRVLRTRVPAGLAEGDRQAFAAVSARYKAFDVDAVANVARAILPADAHVEAVIAPRWQIDVSFANPALLNEARVGMPHRIVVRIEGNDDGTGSVRIKHLAERIRCKNCSLVADKKLRASLRHTADLSQALADALSHSGEALESFGNVWREANETRIHDKYDGSELSAREVFQRLIAHNYVKLPGAPAEQLETLMTAWAYEPGDTAGTVNMAISRAAQDLSVFQRAEAEEQAGELLYARVYELPRLTEEQAARFEA